MKYKVTSRKPLRQQEVQPQPEPQEQAVKKQSTKAKKKA